MDRIGAAAPRLPILRLQSRIYGQIARPISTRPFTKVAHPNGYEEIPESFSATPEASGPIGICR
jgi:hypothetical protein